MPSTIIASPELAQGGLVRTRHSLQRNDDGTFVYSAEYVCLDQFADGYRLTFAVRGGDANLNPPPPLPLPSTMRPGTLRLSSATTVTERGLTYFIATYAGADPNVVEESVFEQQRAFNAVRQCRPRAGDPIDAPPPSASLAFNYISRTVTRSNKLRFPEPPRASELTGPPTGPRRTGRCSVNYRRERIVLRSRTKAANGQFTFTTSATGVYVATN